MKGFKKLILLGSALVISASPIGYQSSAEAQLDLGGIFKKDSDGRIKINLGELLIGLLFGSKKDATPKDSCQLDVDAQSLVDRDIYGANYKKTSSGKLYCNNFKIKGLKGDENTQFAEQYLATRRASTASTGTGEATIIDKKGRSKVIPFSWRDGQQVETTEVLTVIDGVDVPKDVVADSPSRSFRMINVRKGSHLNLRSGASIKHSITGIYKGGNIVLVKAFFQFQPDRKCKSGRWALLQNNGTGNGFVCANYIGEAPALTNIGDVDAFQKPPKAFVTRSSGYTQNKSFITRRKATDVVLQVKGKNVPKRLVSSSTGLQGFKGTARSNRGG